MIDGSPPLITLRMLSQPRLLAAARALIGNVAARVGFTEPQGSQVALAVDEALCNVISHGYDQRPDGEIWVSVWALDGSGEGSGADAPGIHVVIEDRARAVDPESIQPRKLEEIRPGGLGVHIIREVMDEVHYEKREGGGMRLTMRKAVPAADRPVAETESDSRDRKQPSSTPAQPPPR